MFQKKINKLNLCFVEQKRGLQLGVNVGHDRLDPVVCRPSVENEEPEFGVALPLVHEHGTLDVGLVPLVVDVLVQRNLERVKTFQRRKIYSRFEKCTLEKNANNYVRRKNNSFWLLKNTIIALWLIKS